MKTTIDFAVQIVKKTESHYLVDDCGSFIWLPIIHTQVDQFQAGELVTITIPEWLAVESNFI